MPRADIMSLLGKTIQGIEYDEKGYIVLRDTEGDYLICFKEDDVFDKDGNLFDTEYIE